MSVTLRPYRSGGWEVDIALRLPDGSRHRERKRASHFSKSAAQRWGQDREWHLLQHGPPSQEGGAHARRIRAEIRRRPCAGEPAEAERDRRERIDSEGHLVPQLGAKRLDAITTSRCSS